MKVVAAFMKAVAGEDTTEERLAEKRADLMVITVAHNGAEIAAATLTLMILLAEALVRAMGFKDNGTLASVSSPWFLGTGMLAGWRADVSTAETTAVLALLVVARVGKAMLEDKMNTQARHHGGRYIELLTRDGPAKFRYAFAVLLCAVTLIACGELALYGKAMAEARADE